MQSPLTARLGCLQRRQGGTSEERFTGFGAGKIAKVETKYLIVLCKTSNVYAWQALARFIQQRFCGLKQANAMNKGLYRDYH